MATPPRFYVLSATTFDGTTALAEDWTPNNNQNVPRLITQQDEVGRLSFADLARPGTSGCVVMIRRWSAEAEGDKVEVRAVNGDETADDPPTITLDTLLEETTLLSTWSKPLYLGPTDAIAIYHDRAGTVELLVAEELEDILVTHIESAAAESQAAQAAGILTSITLEAAAALAAPPGDLIVFVDFASGDITLPAITDVPLGRRITFIRVEPDAAGVPPRIVAHTPASDQVNGRAGATVTPYLLLRVGDSVTYRRVPQGWAYERGMSSPARNSGAGAIALTAFQDGVQFFEVNGAGTVTLPALANTAIRYRAIIWNSTLDQDVTITADGGATINGLASIPLPPGATAYIENTSTDWLAVFSSVDPPAISSAGAAVPLTAWRGTQFVEASHPTGNINLPSLATIARRGARAIVYNAGEGTITIGPDGGDTINGALVWHVTRGQACIVEASETEWIAIGGVLQPTPVTSGSNVTLDPWRNGPQFVESTGAGGQTITLPSADRVAQGASVVHRNTSANAHVLAAAAGQTINGAANVAVAAATTVIAYRVGGTTWFALTSA